MDLNQAIWNGRRVLLTGHTGFKGSWLSLILKRFGAEVTGFSLPPNTTPSLYSVANIKSDMEIEYFGDIRFFNEVADCFSKTNIDYVFHLAAQPLVRESVRKPLETLHTNIIGTANVLTLALGSKTVAGVTIATTDKVYRNLESGVPFRESDNLGGEDPYSASKAAAEIVVQSLYSSLNPRKIPVTTVRAGNVVGGGDWGDERLIPDLVRALSSETKLLLRNPNSTRPWQYILDCLQGYLLVAQNHLSGSVPNPPSVNFGPTESLNVSSVVSTFQTAFNKQIPIELTQSAITEHNTLQLDSQLALRTYGWKPSLSIQESITRSAAWYSNYYSGISARQLMIDEIEQFWGDIK